MNEANQTVSANRKITVEDVKTWYKGSPRRSGQIATRSITTTTPLDAVPIIPFAFVVQAPYHDSTYTGQMDMIVAPVYNPELNSQTRLKGSFVAFHRDNQGNIRSKLVVFWADSTAYLDPTKVVNSKTFTGTTFLIDEKNNLIGFEKFIDGHSQEKFAGNIPFGNAQVEMIGTAGQVQIRGGADWLDWLFGPSCPGDWRDRLSRFFRNLGNSGSTSSSGGDDSLGGEYVSINFFGSGSVGNGISWTPSNGGGASNTGADIVATYCNSLISGFDDQTLQDAINGEVPLSMVGGVITQSMIQGLEHRNRLRELIIRGLPCEQLYAIQDLSEFSKTAYDFYKANNWNPYARETVLDVIRHINLNPLDKIYLNRINTSQIQSFFHPIHLYIFNAFLQKGVSVKAITDLYNNPKLFDQVGNLLVVNSYSDAAIENAAIHIGLYFSDPDYANAISNANYPDLGSEAWEQAVKDPIFIARYLYAEYLTECAVLRKLYPFASSSDIRWTAFKNVMSDATHIALDICGVLPLFGEGCDFANGVFYTIQGDGTNAALSFAATIPIAGWTVTGAKYAIKVAKISGRGYQLSFEFVGGLIKFGEKKALRSQLRRILSTASGYQAHHIVPLELVDEPLIQLAARGKNPFHINDITNGVNISNTYHYESHPAYTERVRQAMQQIYSSKTLTPTEAYQELQIILQKIRSSITTNSSTNINDIIF